ncbi:hypothetical protein N0V90_003682 [Kalmusia sp. IMI 367209]|nr:hypothetical protein N0V90_003682 [Kalmusia sp. IMI 367209]
MPLYEVFHTYSLSSKQKEQIAKGITDIHCTTFAAPSIFVNVVFHEYNSAWQGRAYTKTLFVGGKKYSSPGPRFPLDASTHVAHQQEATNYVTAHLRPRPDNRDKLIHITNSLMTVWNEYVKPRKPGSINDSKALHTIFLFEDIAAGAEQGFVLPLGGKDDDWAAENMEEFERRAGEGDDGMKELVREIREGKLGKIGKED